MEWSNVNHYGPWKFDGNGNFYDTRKNSRHKEGHYYLPHGDEIIQKVLEVANLRNDPSGLSTSRKAQAQVLW